MKVTLGEDGLSKTWQDDFPNTIYCCYCHGEARIGFVAHEGLDGEKLKEKFVCDLHPNEGKGGYWFHDCCAVAVYFCRNCLQPTALSNQG